jgi:hypothetical protein
MHGIAQVVQQLANDLSLIFLLDPAQDGGVRGWRAVGADARFQTFLRLSQVRELSSRLGSSPTG